MGLFQLNFNKIKKNKFKILNSFISCKKNIFDRKFYQI